MLPDRDDPHLIAAGDFLAFETQVINCQS